MARRSGKKIFVNLPVRDLERSNWMGPAAIREPADAGATA
jgi:hypothetical protein